MLIVFCQAHRYTIDAIRLRQRSNRGIGSINSTIRTPGCRIRNNVLRPRLTYTKCQQRLLVYIHWAIKDYLEFVGGVSKDTDTTRAVIWLI